MGGPCDFGVTPFPIGPEFGFRTALGLGLGVRGPDLGLGLDNTYTCLESVVHRLTAQFIRMQNRDKNCSLFRVCDPGLSLEGKTSWEIIWR